MAIGSSKKPLYIDDDGIYKECSVVGTLLPGPNVGVEPTGNPNEFRITVDGSGGGGSGGVNRTGCVPDYSKYDASKHDVVTSSITTYGNEDKTLAGRGYAKTLSKTIFGSKVFVATEDCFFFPFAYALTTPVGTTAGEAYPIAVYVGSSSSCTELFRVCAVDDSRADNMSAWYVPLKQGQILAMWNGGKQTSASQIDDNLCYWLPIESLSPQQAFPDWDPATRSANMRDSLVGGTVFKASKAGFIVAKLCVNDGVVSINVNNEPIASWYPILTYGAADYVTMIVPVSINDNVTLSRTSEADPTADSTIYFYQTKGIVANPDLKADKKIPAVVGNLAALDASGNLTDSGVRLAGLATVDHTHAEFRYALTTVTTGSTMSDRAVNVLNMVANSTLKLPAQVTGKVRDFILTVEVTTSSTLTFTMNDGSAFTSYMYDENEENPLAGTYEAGATYQFYFTERNANKFRISRTKLVSPS